MSNPRPRLLKEVLRGVSRSFYLSLQVLPGPLREPMSLAYALARSADTIADTRALPKTERIGALKLLMVQLSSDTPDYSKLEVITGLVSGPLDNPWEKLLVQRLPEAARLLSESTPGDRRRIRSVLNGLISGMVQDLSYFPGESGSELRAFKDLDDLDRYTYHAAGVVGEFWTEMCHAHLPSLRGWDLAAMKAAALRFGKGLQLVNVLKDIPRDLEKGRCYIPANLLGLVGLVPEELFQPGAIHRVRPIVRHLVQLALDHFEFARAYTLAIPRREYRLRLACIWPLWIGLKTLPLVLRAEDLLDPNVHVKIPRSTLYALIRRSLVAALFDALVDGYSIAFRNEVEAVLNAGAAH